LDRTLYKPPIYEDTTVARDFKKEDSNKSLVQASFDRWKT
jgi:hypothetical protein